MTHNEPINQVSQLKQNIKFKLQSMNSDALSHNFSNVQTNSVTKAQTQNWMNWKIDSKVQEQANTLLRQLKSQLNMHNFNHLYQTELQHTMCKWNAMYMKIINYPKCPRIIPNKIWNEIN